MSFRCRQKYRGAHCCPVFSMSQVTLESGEVVNRMENLAEIPMPKPELFDLKAQLKAGVNLEEVASTVIHTSHVDVGKVLTKAIKQSKKAPVEPEVNNED